MGSTGSDKGVRWEFRCGGGSEGYAEAQPGRGEGCVVEGGARQLLIDGGYTMATGVFRPPFFVAVW
jgi:hypothetical protein